jgi:Transposase IS4
METDFSNSLLDKIVKYTNEYGVVHAKRWKDISRKDLESFFSVLFISGIQKRKDKPSNWFSENRLLENPLMKKVLSGRKFFNMLRYLHCCPVQNQDHSADNYSPSYKIAKVLQDYLENRYLKLFVPGQQLSLDETLIQAFGRIEFKVRIVTKAARYVIKIYVITDAATAFVLWVVIYTGKTTYYSDLDSLQDRLKMVQVVNCLVEPFVGTHRTIYINRFYTSLDLLKSLAEKQLYVTGTMLANRIPQGIRVAKTSQTFKQMKQGDALKCRVGLRTKSGQESQAGLLCWRDWNMVYCLSNDSNNFEFD